MPTIGDLPILVFGLDPVGQAIVHRLHALRIPVRVALTPVERAQHGAMLDALGVETLEVGELWQNDFAKLDLVKHGAVVLAGDDDAENVDACLVARRCCGEVPIAVRVSDQTLVRFLRMSVPHVDAYSMGSTTAPVAAELAMQIYAKRPPIQRDQPLPKRARPPQLSQASRVLFTVLSACLVLVPVAALTYQRLLHLPLWRAFALAWRNLLANGLEAPMLGEGPPSARVMSLLLSIAGRVMLACFTGLIVDWLITRRFAPLLASMPVRLRDHVVVFGAGNVGARVAELLHKRKIAVAVVESSGSLRNVQRLRSRGIPVVVGDATVDETLDLANAWRAGLCLALTNSDAVNLHVGLLLADKKVGVPVVVRLLSPELSALVTDQARLTPVSPVAETASHVCRTVANLRQERLKHLNSAQQLADPVRNTGRYAGAEFEPVPIGAETPSGDMPTIAPAAGEGTDAETRA
jgi:Trk K+ transport system NAD-binding subunit